MLKCLMLKTKDRRRFFTHEDHFDQLVGFTNLMGAEVSVVKIDESAVLNIDELATAICNKNYVSPKEYELIEVRTTKSSGKRQQFLKLAKEIREFIRSELITNKSVTHRRVKERFADFHLSNDRISKHLKFVSTMLQDEYRVEHPRRGEYRIC